MVTCSITFQMQCSLLDVVNDVECNDINTCTLSIKNKIVMHFQITPGCWLVGGET